MTIKELISKLQEFPEDMEVIDYEGNEISKVEIIDDIYHGDIDIPYVVIR